MLSADGPFASSLFIPGKLSTLLACLVPTYSLSSAAPCLGNQTCDDAICTVQYGQIMHVSVSYLPCGDTYKRISQLHRTNIWLPVIHRMKAHYKPEKPPPASIDRDVMSLNL